MQSFENGIEHDDNDDDNNGNNNKHGRAGLAYMDKHPELLFSRMRTAKGQEEKTKTAELV